MPSYTAIDYAAAFFPIPVLPRIVGKPTYEKLREMKKALKANAASVQSDLGSGAFGHLGLVLDDVTYNTLTGHNYVRPLHPGALIIAAGTPHHEAVRLREIIDVSFPSARSPAGPPLQVHLSALGLRLLVSLTP